MKGLFSRTFKFLIIVFGTLSAIFLFVGIMALNEIPSAKDIKGCLTTKMYHVHLCPTSNTYVRYSDISPILVKSIVMTEDSAFWQHGGFDFLEMRRSLETNLKKGKYARGGSTITQQLARNLFLTEQKTLMRKALEALITLRLEKNLSKKEILEKYLNVVHLGDGIFGIKQASQFYFKKSPARLDAVESAFLAFLLPSPVKYSKSFFKKELTPFARERITEILTRLYEYEKISGGEYEIARGRINTFIGQTPVVANPEIENTDEQSEDVNTEFNE